MSYDLASVTIVGRLGKDPENYVSKSGTSVARFAVAVNLYNSGEKSTTWFDVSAFGKSADVCMKSLSKGSKVMIIGDLSLKSYDKDDGSKGYRARVAANRIVLLDKKDESKNRETDKETDDGVPC